MFQTAKNAISRKKNLDLFDFTTFFAWTFLNFLSLLTYIISTFAGIGRTLIPRYFRSIFEGGVTDLRYELRHPKESFHNTSITMDCDQCVVATLHGKPMFTKVSQYFFLFTSIVLILAVVIYSLLYIREDGRIHDNI